jgi:hypothetical protein
MIFQSHEFSRGFFSYEAPMRRTVTQSRFLWNCFEKPPPFSRGVPVQPLIISGLGCNHTQV